MKSLPHRTTPPNLGRYVCRKCSNRLLGQRRFYAAAAKPELYDIVCVGGGPAGLSLLAALRMYECIVPLKATRY